MNNALLIMVLAIAFGQDPGIAPEPREVAFAELPRECVVEYLPFLKRERSAESTLVLECDLDGDGKKEMFVWTGEGGSGGEVWSVMTCRDSLWYRAGQLFGNLFLVDKPPYRGVLVETPLGWEYATWEYWELRDDELQSRLKLQVRYRESDSHVLREKPRSIEILE